jgi:hypothetical protein
MPLKHVWLTLLAVLVIVLIPRRASAQDPRQEPSPNPNSIDCSVAEVLPEFTDAERGILGEQCRTQTGEVDKSILENAFKLGGWRAVFVARVASQNVDPGKVDLLRARQLNAEIRFKQLLESKHQVKGKPEYSCAAMRKMIGTALVDHSNNVASPTAPRLTELKQDNTCALKHSESGTPEDKLVLDELGAEWRLFTVPSRPGDVVRAWIYDGEVVYKASSIPYDDGVGHNALLVLVPADKLAAFEIIHADLDIPWTHVNRFHESEFQAFDRDTDCLVVEVSTDVEKKSDWTLVMEGKAFVLRPTEPGENDQRESLLHRQVLNITRGKSEGRSSHDIAFVRTSTTADSTSDETDNKSQDHIWVSSLVDDTNSRRQGGCRIIAYDLTALKWSASYGLEVSVEPECTQQGVHAAKLRAYSEQYVNEIGGSLIHLDEWAETLRNLNNLLDSLDSVGRDEASQTQARAPQQDRLGAYESMHDLANVLVGKGVNALLDLEVTCTGSTVQVTGKALNLNEFANRPSAWTRTRDIDTDVLRMKSYSTNAASLREAMEVVLGNIVEDKKHATRGHVRIASLPRQVARGSKTPIHAVAGHANQKVEGSESIWIQRIKSDQCNSIRKVNSLASQQHIIPEELVTDRSPLDPPSPVPVGDKGRKVRRKPMERTINLGGLAPGTYAAYAKHAGSFAVVCFMVSEQNLQGFVNLSGFQQSRGQHLLQNPRADQLTFVRLLGGVRYIVARNFVEFGPEIGYERLGYAATGSVSWDGPTSATGLVKWERHGLLLGGFLGPRLPFSRCALRPQKVWVERRCGLFGASTLAFFNLHLLANVGFLDLRDVPNGAATEALDIDMDVALVGGLRGKPPGAVTIGVFIGLLLTDVTRARDLRQAASYKYDWSTRFIAGLEMAWGGDTRKKR